MSHLSEKDSSLLTSLSDQEFDELITIAEDVGPDVPTLPQVLKQAVHDRLSRRGFARLAIAKIAAASVVSAFLIEGQRRGVGAWSFDPNTYTTPICCRCYPVTQWYGSGSHVYGENARAIDIGTPNRTPVYATKSGRIAFEGWEGAGGIVARINHNDGLQTIFAHLSQTVVNTGQSVTKDYTLIGYTGATGNVSGPHLHWALKVQGTSSAIRLDGIRGISRSQVCP